jgi:hypothetical protein
MAKEKEVDKGDQKMKARGGNKIVEKNRSKRGVEKSRWWY